MDKGSPTPLSSRDMSARTCLIVAGVLLVSGTVVISPTAGIAAIILGGLVSAIGTCLGYARYGNIGLALLVAAVLLTAWRLPDARTEYGRYLDKVLEESR